MTLASAKNRKPEINWTAKKMNDFKIRNRILTSSQNVFVTLIGSPKYNPTTEIPWQMDKNATDIFDVKTLIMLSMRTQETCLNRKA